MTARPRIPKYASFQQQYTCCGKKTCNLCFGKSYAHGPYWYATWWDARRERHRTAYVGIELSAWQEERVRAQRLSRDR